MKPYFKPAGWPSYLELLEVAESAWRPSTHELYGEEEFYAKEGWKVAFEFKGSGRLNCISYFIRPDGEKFDPWEEMDLFFMTSPIKQWNGFGQLARMVSEGTIRHAESLWTSDMEEFRRNERMSRGYVDTTHVESLCDSMDAIIAKKDD